MRLVRFDAHPARISDDIRAALTSIGRGDNLIGGLGLVGVQPPGVSRAVDAVLVLPHGLLIVVGVDLPDPAMRLEAPLSGQWKTDGWPLVRTDNAANPATGALALADEVAAKVRHAVSGAPVGTIVAVGPYVETVEQPPADLTGAVRVVYPTSTSMLAASVSLATAQSPLTTAHVRSVVSLVAPDADEVDGVDDDALLAEGFVPAEADSPAVATLATTEPMAHPASRSTESATAPAARQAAVSGHRAQAPAVAPPQPEELTQPLTPFPRQRPPATPSKARRPPGRAEPRDGRWHALAAGLALFSILVASIVIALGTKDPGGSGGDQAGATPTTAAVVPAGGLQFTERAAGSHSDCAKYASGDLQVALSGGGCVELRRGSYETTMAGRRIAVSVAWLTFADEAAATGFHDLARTPGSGAITDIATQTRRWPEPAPRFANAAYVTSAEGATVRLVQAAALHGPSTPDDRNLIAAAQAAIDLELKPS